MIRYYCLDERDNKSFCKWSCQHKLSGRHSNHLTFKEKKNKFVFLTNMLSVSMGGPWPHDIILQRSLLSLHVLFGSFVILQSRAAGSLIRALRDRPGIWIKTSPLMVRAPVGQSGPSVLRQTNLNKLHIFYLVFNQWRQPKPGQRTSSLFCPLLETFCGWIKLILKKVVVDCTEKKLRLWAVFWPCFASVSLCYPTSCSSLPLPSHSVLLPSTWLDLSKKGKFRFSVRHSVLSMLRQQ